MNKKVIITGATGQDGSYMIEYLLENTDCEIVAAIRRTSQLIDSNIKNSINNPRVKIVHLDLCDAHSIASVVKNEKPNYFINFGAQTFVADSWKSPINHMTTNSLGLIHILEAVKNFTPSCRVYSSGSSEEFGNVEYSPQDILHPMKPRSPYGISKCAARLVCKTYRESYGLYVVHGILFNHESPRRQKYFVTRKITHGIATIIHAIKNNQPFKPIELGNLDAKRDWSDSRDFVVGVWKMLNQEKPKDYVLASGQTQSIRAFLNKALQYSNFFHDPVWQGEGLDETLSADFLQNSGEKRRMVIVKVNPEFYRPNEVELLLGDSRPARKELGWEPQIPFDKLVKDMVESDINEISK